MFDRMMGQFLIDQGKLTGAQIDQVYEQQAQGRARLGVIAVTEKLMSIPQAEEINSLQASEDKKYGELAIDKGYLQKDQVDRLLERQGNEFMSFCQALVDRGYMSLEQITEATQAYQEKYGMMDSEMEALRNNDLDRIVPIFAKDAGADVRRLLTIVVKNIYRLVDPHITIGYLQIKSAMTGECVGYQKLLGSNPLTTSITGAYNDLQKVAMSYTKEEFIETKEDAMDALCELINCANGLYATEISTDSDPVDLDPPIYLTSYANVTAPEIYSLPVYCSRAHVFINVSKSAVTDIR